MKVNLNANKKKIKTALERIKFSEAMINYVIKDAEMILKAKFLRPMPKENKKLDIRNAPKSSPQEKYKKSRSRYYAY